jgi:BNR/Asp-box repeat
MRRSMVVSILFVAAMIASVVASVPAMATPTNVDVSRRHLNESEEAIAVNPTNPENIVVVTNVGHREAGLAAGMLAGVSFDGGHTWATRLIGNNDNLGDACCDPSLSFDQHGNLFLTYLFEVENVVPVALSTDGGLSFHIVANIGAGGSATASRSGTDDRGLFRFVDQPTITTGEDEAWVIFNAGGPMVATGARVTGLGQVGSFAPVEVVSGTNNCTYGDVAIGPSGQVMNVCTLTETGQGGGKLFVSVDPDRLGPALFGKRVFVTDTHIGGFDFIPPQPDRSVDAEPGLAWDRTGGPHTGRVYLVYTLEVKNESDNTDIEVRYSDDNGATWSAPVRVNDDATANSQFLPKISLDPTTGNVAVIWYDSRQDLGTGGPGDTNGVPNDDAQVWGAFSTDGGRTFTPNVKISAGTSNSPDSGNGIDYGDYSGLSFFGGIAHPAWSDNSNSTGTNPDGALHQLDIYTAAVHV